MQRAELGRGRAPRARAGTRSSSARLLEVEEADERPQPVAGRRNDDVRDGGRAEYVLEVAALRRGIDGESRPQPAVTGVDLELLPRLRVDQPNDADVRKLLLAAVADLDGDHVVTGCEAKERPAPAAAPVVRGGGAKEGPPPVERPSEIRDDDDKRAAAHEPRRAVARIGERR